MERLRCHVRVREASDDKLLVLLAEEVFRPLAEARGHAERFHADQFLDLLERAEVYVADARGQAGEVAGFVALEEDGGTLAVRCLCVAPAHEAQGVAHQLLDWTEGLAYGRGAVALQTVLPKDDGHSRRLFQSHAYEVLPATAGSDVTLLCKRLAAAP